MKDMCLNEITDEIAFPVKGTISVMTPIGKGEQKVGNDYFENTLRPFLKKELDLKNPENRQLEGIALGVGMAILMHSKDVLARLGCSGDELARMYSEAYSFYEKKMSETNEPRYNL